MVSFKTILSTTILACAIPTFAQNVIRQKVTVAEAAETLKITEAQAEALITDATQESFQPADLVQMFGINTTTMEEWDRLNFNKRVISTAAETITRYLELPVASSKRNIDSNELEWAKNLFVVRQEFEDALHQSQVLLQQNQTESLNQAASQHGTVCEGKGAKCALCFVGTSMIYLGASTGCALAAVAVTGATAGALTPAALTAFGSCMLGTTGTLISTISSCGE